MAGFDSLTPEQRALLMAALPQSFVAAGCTAADEDGGQAAPVTNGLSHRPKVASTAGNTHPEGSGMQEAALAPSPAPSTAIATGAVAPAVKAMPASLLPVNANMAVSSALDEDMKDVAHGPRRSKRGCKVHILYDGVRMLHSGWAASSSLRSIALLHHMH